MSTSGKKSKPTKFFWIRLVLVPILLLSVLIGCISGISLLSVLPMSTLPGAVDFMLNLFETEAVIENSTNETLFVTPITTTFMDIPQVISQPQFIRQRDFPIKPNESITLRYDSADAFLSGVAVCKENRDCRMLPTDYSNTYQITSFDSLSDLDPTWLAAVETYPEYSYGLFVLGFLSLFPFLIAWLWLYTGKVEERQRNKEVLAQEIFPLEEQS